MNVLSADYLFELFDKKSMRSTYFVSLYFENDFDCEAYKYSLLQFVWDNDLLHFTISNDVDGKKWKLIDTLDAERIFREYQLNCPMDAFLSRSMEFFCKYKEKYIDIGREGPIKSFAVKCLQSSQVILVFCLHHSVSDARGWLQVIKQIGDQYAEKKTYSEGKGRNPKISKHQKFNLKDCYERYYQEGVDRNHTIREEISNMVPFLKKSGSRQKITDTELYANFIKSINVKSTKEKLKDIGFTINDLLIYLSLKLNAKLDDTDNKIVMTSYRVDLRKYLEDDYILNNLSFEQLLTADKQDLSDIQKIKHKIDESKILFGSYEELMLYEELDLLPPSISESLLEKGMEDKQEDMCKGIASTNIGDVSNDLKGFGSGLKDVYIIPVYFEKEAIMISAVSFHDRMNISIMSNSMDKEINDKVTSELIDLLPDFTA